MERAQKELDNIGERPLEQFVELFPEERIDAVLQRHQAKKQVVYFWSECAWHVEMETIKSPCLSAIGDGLGSFLLLLGIR